MKKSLNSPWKKAGVVLCLTLFVVAGVLFFRGWPTTSPPEQTQNHTVTDKPATEQPSPNVVTQAATQKSPSTPVAHQPVAAKPQVKAEPLPNPVSQQEFTAITPLEGEINVIRSFDQPLSDWPGQFEAGVQSRMVRLNPAMLNSQPLKEGELLTFQLFDDVKVEAVVADSFTNVNGTVSTTAKLKDSTWGRAFLASTDGQLQVRIRIPEEGKIYAIQFNQQTQQHYTLELDPVLAEPDEGDDQQIIPTNLAADESGGSIAAFEGSIMQEDEATDASAVVDVMVVYTDDALVNAGSQATMDNNIALGVSMANDAHTNTGSFIIWNLIHSYEVSYAETGSNSTDLYCVTYVADSCLDAVHTQRTAYGADFVIMMNGTGSGGIAWVLQSSSGSSAYAFSVVDDNSFLSYTPVHEVGHNMGLSHARDQNYQPGPTNWYYDPHGFGTTTAGWHWHPTAGATGYCSVMTYTSGTYFADGLHHLRVGVFSDPNITDHGMPTGHVVNGDSARVLRQLRHTYAAYRNRFNTPTIKVDSPNGGEMLIAGNTYTLLWDSYGVTGEVEIELLKNGSLNQVIDANTLNDRVYSWTVPAGISGTGYAIRVSNLAGNITDTSDATFDIATVFYDQPLNSNPGFTTTGEWEYGIPVAVNNATWGGPSDAYTGTNIYDTDLNYAAFTDSNLTTISIDCSDYSDIKLKFMGQFSVANGDYAKVQVSNNGTAWTDLYSATDLWATNWSEYEYDISAVADGQSTVYIRWAYDDGTSNSRSGMSVDDIQLFGLSTSTEPTVTLSINNSTIAENGGVATVTAMLSQSHTSFVTVNLGFSGIAFYGVDYMTSGASITIAPTRTTGTITINSINDALDEPNETVIVDISSVINGMENGTQQVTTTILDDDHTVTFQTDSTPGATLSGITTQTVTNGGNCSPVTANAPANYIFTNWSGGASSTANPLTVTNVTSSLTITANYAQTYTVSYDGNGKSGGSAPSSQTKNHNVNLTLATNSGNLEKTGYTFAGWNTETNGSGTDYAVSATYSANTSVTLYAKWTTLPTYAVTYNANNPTSGTAPSDQTKTHGANLTLATNSGNLEKTGYTCTGWNTAANGGGTNYDFAEPYSSNAPLTLFAKWTALPTYTVTYDANSANSGTVPPNQTKTHGTDLTLATNSGTLKKAGSVFAGWNTEADGTGTYYAEGAAYNVDTSVTLYAKWKPFVGGFMPAIDLLLLSSPPTT